MSRILVVIFEPIVSASGGCFVAVLICPPLAYYAAIGFIFDVFLGRDITPVIGDMFWSGVGVTLIAFFGGFLGTIWRIFRIPVIACLIAYVAYTSVYMYGKTAPKRDRWSMTPVVSPERGCVVRVEFVDRVGRAGIMVFGRPAA